MNRQVWTNQRSHLSITIAKEQGSALCGKVEYNATHVLSMHSSLNQCGSWSERQMLHWQAGLPDCPKILYWIHAHSVLYHMHDSQVQGQHASQVMACFQEIKQNLIDCRFQRCTGTVELSSLTDQAADQLSRSYDISVWGSGQNQKGWTGKKSTPI